MDEILSKRLLLKNVLIPLSKMFCEECNDYTSAMVGYCTECCRKGRYSDEEVTDAVWEAFKKTKEVTDVLPSD